jgi:general secretion pathway protein H
VATVTTPTSYSNSFIRRDRGFTLMEIMVVLAIIGGIIAVVAPRLVDKKTKMRSLVRELATVIHECHNMSRLFNSTYRLAITMSDAEGNSGGEYTIESAPGNVSLLTPDEQKEQEKEEDSLSEDERKAKPKVFAADSRIIKEAKKLPRGLFITEVEYGNRAQSINGGVAYIHFFPQGLAEEAAIHITDKKNLNWTIVVHPLTGVADIFDGNKPLKELRSE